ncbi:MAG TPA: BrnA antitoxin family protein [Roseiarcus sp.]|nr:BrnA antitoxin family protein [Roseiarcus sp.]
MPSARSRPNARGEDQRREDAREAPSLGEDFWKDARIATLPGKTSVHLRLDSDMIDWFKAKGKGHLTRMNALLRAYVDAQQRRR